MAGDRISTSGEIWKSIVGYEGRYEISSIGRVWSVPRKSSRSGVILHPSVTPKGYRRVSLTDSNGKACSKAVHGLVLAAFVGPREKGMEAAHLNGDPSDNRLTNLIWATSCQNKQHQKLHLTQRFGADHPNAVLTNEQVAEIKRMRAQGMYWRDIAAAMGVSYGTARSAGLGLRYGPRP